MFKKATTAAFFMTILPLEMTFGAEPLTPQENPAKQSLTTDMIEELVSLNKNITALLQDNGRNLSNINTYLRNHQKIQNMRDHLQIDQNSLNTHINFVQTLSSHLIDNELKITEDNSNSIKDLEGKIETSYKKLSKNYHQSDSSYACNSCTFKLDITPISFEYVDYQGASLFTIMTKLFRVEHGYDLRLNPGVNISIKQEIDADDITDCLKTISSYQKSILSHSAILAKIEAINSTHLEVTKSIIEMNIKKIDENQDIVKTLLGLK